MERKYIVCDPEHCTGCGICEMVCSSEKEGVYCPELSRIHLVHVDEKMAISIACRFCENTPCINACPREALEMDDENNIIRLDKMRCTGCGWCIEACDFGAITVGPDKVAIVCDLCEGDPKCITICPTEALSWQTRETAARKSRIAATTSRIAAAEASEADK